jgi:predicted 2-oxoglutarate/Fe(II)-dependent dioxygenase YbiX
LSFSVGDKIPAIFGATANGRFYSLDSQAGRPAVLVALGALDPRSAQSVLEGLEAARAGLNAAGVDAVPLAPAGAALEWAMAAPPDMRDRIVYVAEAGGFEMGEIDGAPAAIMIDRSGRIVGLEPFDNACDWVDCYRQHADLPTDTAARPLTASAPALIVPNVASRDFCRALIAHFEASPHTAGVMASFSQDGAYAKVDEDKKRRRDIELTADSPLYAPVVDILANRCVPEIKRAFQKDVAYLDRILIARYDDTGGYFKRHRDNAAPHTRFREFAISINLNTPDYEGGHLLFPEYDDHGYSPPTGGAIIFSASLLHEAAPVTKGSRYVLLSFFCGEAAGAGVTPGG